ncbi:TPA: hypothetical protein N0F65_003810 [Lagenidium giganteum]|uniref:RING-type domain-containing protein n=1 Tax=Lagenidium giganteum TaxID=4803 RepID=A0AAV2YZ84_9STRA|nr:TPA: hypothetical protein N0F65_003810 [Lagenidium giganteum]
MELVGHVLYYFDHHGEGPEGACYGSAVHKATFWTIVMHDTAVAVIAFLPILTFLILTVVDHFAPVQNRHVYVNGALPEELRELAVERVNASMCGHDDASCEICLDDYEEGEELRLLPCRHHFHQSCVDEWLGKVPSCPKCQGTIYEEPMSTADGDHEKTE